MNEFEKKWWLYFVPECYFDTVLLKKILRTNRRLMHRKGCNNVMADLDSKRLDGLFAVGIIDKDKTELDFLKSCDVIYNANKVILWKHAQRSQFVIQLNPPLEKWVIEILDENQLKIEDFGYSREYKKLKKQIKNDIDNEGDVKLNRLIAAIIKTNCEAIRKLKAVLHHLKEQNYQFDINELKNG